MTQHATCSSCGAGFEVDFAPGTEFTCGGCGSVVIVPHAAPAAPPPVVMPRAPKPAPAPAPVAVFAGCRGTEATTSFTLAGCRRAEATAALALA